MSVLWPTVRRLFSPRRVSLAAAVVVTAGLAGQLGTGPAAAAGTSVVVRPGISGASLSRLFSRLGPGSQVRFAPGTYRLGYWDPVLQPGRPTARITVTALDPSHPPLLQGMWKMRSPSYWTVSRMRFQATVPGDEAISVLGSATGWQILSNDIFGAAQTGAYANLSVPAGQQRAFRIAGNAIHDAGRSSRSQTDHNLYLNFAGDPTTSGLVDHNLIYNHPNGVGIKIGDGGAAGARGPWGLTIADNTVLSGGRQMLLHGDVRNNLVYGNLFGRSTAPFTSDPRTTTIYVHMVNNRTNLFRNNYAFGASMFTYDPDHALLSGGDNGLRADPRLTGGTSWTGMVPTAPAARPYGHRGTGVFTQAAPSGSAPGRTTALALRRFDASWVNICWRPVAPTRTAPVSGYDLIQDGRVVAHVGSTTVAGRIRVGHGRHSLGVRATGPGGAGAPFLINRVI